MESYCKDCFAEIIINLFIPETIELIDYFKKNNVKIVLLSMSIDPLVKQYSEYFNVPYYCLRVNDESGKAVVDLSNQKNFKFNIIQKYDPAKTVVIADSKHDLPILRYCKYPIVISHKKNAWISLLENPLVIEVGKGLR